MTASTNGNAASQGNTARHLMQGGMYVVKRDGRQEPVAFDKITARIQKLAHGLNEEFCDPVRMHVCCTSKYYLILNIYSFHAGLTYHVVVVIILFRLINMSY